MNQTLANIIKALDRLRVSSLYVHNAELEGAKFSVPELKGRKVYLVETLAVLNALVEKGTMLLYGGHGGGKTTLSKYLGQLFCHYSKEKNRRLYSPRPSTIDRGKNSRKFGYCANDESKPYQRRKNKCYME
jgi:energy-coupling factor transporter ATP-binding protein EcfA2